MDPHEFQLGPVKCSTHTIAQLLDELGMLLRDKSVEGRTILCVNAHIFNLAWSDVALREALNSARIVTADGMGILLASRLVGVRVSKRCNMTEAFRAFLQTDDMPASQAVLLGLTADEAGAAARTMEQMSTHCRITRVISGYLEEAEYRRIFESLGDVDLILIGMGTPRTERICEIARDTCPRAIVWGIGGGTIKIFAGTMKEAPIFWRRYGLQWLHRLCSDPLGLWPRYLIGIPLFFCRILKSAHYARRG